MVYFHYDENNQLKGFNFNGEEYIYERDITGTILRIIKIDGTIEVSYRYNGWGDDSAFFFNSAYFIVRDFSFHYQSVFYE